MKQAVLNLMLASGAFAPFRLANRRKALILTYHRFSRSDEESATSARAFAGQLEYLFTHYTIVPLSLLAESLTSGAELAPGTVALTIDDGYRDAYEIAFPILRRYRAPATIFVVTDFVDQQTWLWTDKLRYLTARTLAKEFTVQLDGGELRFELKDRAARLAAAERVNSELKRLPERVKDETILRLASSLGVRLPELPPREFSALTWSQVREMEAAGIEIGSHTLTHPILNQLDDEPLRRELRESRSRLAAALGRQVEMFCYPNGDYDARVLREVARAGYRFAVTIGCGFTRQGSHPLALRRMTVEPDLAHFAQSTSGFEQVKNRLRFGFSRTGEEPAGGPRPTL